MTLQLVSKHDETDIVLHDLERTQKLCQILMKTPHYAKMGEVGIFAVIQKAQSMGMNPLEALNGGMYFVQGKVEMQGQAMLSLIRSKGHSVSLDPKSTDTCVIMHGKRADNGDTWTVQFSTEDAKRAGIYRNQWEKMPKVMCMWRCVSQLSRFLFSDVIKGVYVQGEISESPAFDAPVNYEENKEEKPKIEMATNEEFDQLAKILSECSEEYQETVKKFTQKNNINEVGSMPKEIYNKIKIRALEERAKNLAKTIHVSEEEFNEEVVDE